jgi:hypothetical protein
VRPRKGRSLARNEVSEEKGAGYPAGVFSYHSFGVSG